MLKRCVIVAIVAVALSLVVFSRKADAAGCEVRSILSTVPNLTFFGVPLCDANGAQWVSLATLLKTEEPASPLRYISVGVTEDKHTVKDAPGSLFSITATNTNAAIRYLKCENDTSANTTVGSETPEWTFAIPSTLAGGPLNYAPPLGVLFTALTCWLVTGAADSDVAEVAANEVMVNYTFK